MPISAKKLLSLKKCIQSFDAELVAVSKTKIPSEILEVYNMGQRVFGENRVKELREKQPQLPSDIEWHAIGNLQTNKVKYIAPFINLIHSADSPHLLDEINKQAARNNRIIPVLLQIKIAQEESKHGFDYQELCDWLSTTDLALYPHLSFAGVMGMATFTTDLKQVRIEFMQLKKYFDYLQKEFFNEAFKEISMGMSGDYEIALEEGATLVRIGTLIFGSRN